MSDPQEERTSFTGETVKILGCLCEEGKPEGKAVGQWRAKLGNREEMLKYLSSCERYWYGEEGFGSEKRQTPA